MLTSTPNERQLRLLCAHKEGESIPSIERTSNGLRPPATSHVKRLEPDMRARVAILTFVISTTVFASESLEKLLATNPELEAERAFVKGDQRYIVLPICGSAKGEVLPGWPLQYTPAHLEAIEKGKRPFTCAELGPEPGNLSFLRSAGYAEAFNRRLLQLVEKTRK